MTAPLQNINPDLLLKGGHVLDPASGIDEALDVAITAGKVAGLARDIPAAGVGQVLDVSGCTVTPGLLDIHAHVFIGHARSRLSLHPDAHTFASGVTTVVDTGTSGWRDFAQFKSEVIDHAKTRIFAFINIVGSGMGGAWEHDVNEMDPQPAAAAVDAYPNVTTGIKTAHYWAGQMFDAAHPPWAAVDNAVAAGRLCGKPVMVDFWPHPQYRPYPQLILEKMRPGDIHTHVFAQQFPVLDDLGLLQPYMRQARDRGVIFDLGHGAASFWYRNAVPAIEQGFLPDSISTDLHTGSMNGPVFDMLTTVNKCLAMGLSVAEVIARSTVAPAREIGHAELGTLRPGSDADVAVFRLERGHFRFPDCGRTVLESEQRLRCVATVRAGAVVYNPEGLGMPTWRDAPDRYWWDPARQASTRPVPGSELNGH